ncbi:MAG: hypothetical protein KA116_12990, partial [Proteobacteria bacterium]|nr:hypothetical protein [Pseudomonadota bacterium]
DKGHPLNAQTATHYNKDGSLKPRPAHRNDITDAQWKIEAEDALAEAKVKKFLDENNVLTDDAGKARKATTDDVKKLCDCAKCKIGHG